MCNHMDEEFQEFTKSHSARKSCDFCSEHWGTLARLFSSQEEFENSAYFGGGDRVVNDPNGVTIATWVGKHNVGNNAANLWLCVPAHPSCGCTWEEHSFKEEAKKEDWFSEMDWSKYD